MVRSKDLRALGVDSSIAHAHFVHLIHQLADEIETETGVAERRDSTFGREDYLGVLDRVLKVVFAPHDWRSIAHFNDSSRLPAPLSSRS
jgi:hypothetical protein